MRPNVDALLVEDNPGDAMLIERYLDDPSLRGLLEDLSLTHVESLTAGREELESAHYDAVLLDLGLPESDGIETLRRVTDAEPAVPVIVLTGLDDTAVAVEAIQSGAQDYLQKGNLDGDRLVRSLRYAIERHKQEQALARRNEQLDFFNSILRHDMLNGLTVITGRADLLKEELDDPDHVDYARDIRRWSDDIIDLTDKVRSILDTVTDDQTALEPVQLAPVVTTEAERVRRLEDRVDIEVDVPEGLSVLANDLLSDVVGNLLTNALEHTDAETTVVTTARDEGSRVRLRIDDDGPGIAPERRESIFERGETGPASTGSGFGLFFVSSMVDSYGGDVRVEESDRGGASFVVELPRA